MFHAFLERHLLPFPRNFRCQFVEFPSFPCGWLTFPSRRHCSIYVDSGSGKMYAHILHVNFLTPERKSTLSLAQPVYAQVCQVRKMLFSVDYFCPTFTTLEFKHLRCFVCLDHLVFGCVFLEGLAMNLSFA